MKSRKSKKRYIDELYETRREGSFYAGDGTSHRPKKDIIIRKWHIVVGCVVLAAVLWALLFLVNPDNQKKNLGTPIFSASDTAETQDKSEDSTIIQDEDKSPWFSVSSSGILYFHPEKFEGSHLIIPKRFNNQTVERLDGESFSAENSTVTRLTIHEGLQVIGEGAFSKFSALHKVDLAATLQRIGADSFSGTPWYKENDDEFLVVGKGVLIKYSGDNDVITLPENVGVIDGAVFQGVKCETVIIPEQTTYIGSRAFKDCTAEKIVIPDSVQFVENDAFENCTWLENRDEEFVVEGAGVLLKCNSTASTIRLPDEVVMVSGFDPKEQGKDITLVLGPNVSKIADLDALGNVKAFKVDARNGGLSAKSGVLYSADGSTLYRYPVYKGGSVFYTADSTLKIGNNAFSGATLKTVELYDGLLVVGNEAFKNCKNLESVSLPDTVTELGTFVFRGCEKLEDATVSESIKALPQGTFMDCESLKSVALSEGMAVISPLSFKGCDSLKYFYVTKNVSRLSSLAFDEGVEFDVDGANKHFSVKNGRLKKIQTDDGASVLVGIETEKNPF